MKSASSIRTVPSISSAACENGFSRRLFVGGAFATAVGAVCTLPATATNQTWIGGDTVGDPVDWNNAANWNSAAPSSTSDKAIFGSEGSTGLVDLGAANRSCGGFTFNNLVDTTITSNGVGKTITTSSAGGECFITMGGGSHVIDANLNGSGNLRIKGTGDLTLSKEVWAATFSIGKTGGSGAYTGTVTLSGEVHGRGLELGDMSYGSLSPLTLVIAGNITNTYATSSFFSGITVRATAGSHLVKDTYNGSAISDVTFDGPGDLSFSNAMIDTAGVPDVATWTTNGTGKVVCQKLTSWDVVWPGYGTGIGLVKAGPGTLEVQGTATYSGPTSVDGGTLIVTKPASLPGYLGAKVLVASGATLAVRAGGLIGVDEQWLSSDIDGLLATNSFASGASLGIEVNALNTFSYENDIGSNEIAKGLVKLGAGSLTLSGTNTFTGATTVSDGELLVNGTLAADSAVTVGASATLGGNGIVAGVVTAAGTLAPGAGIGALTLGNTTLTGTYLCELDGASADSLTSGSLDITGATLTFSSLNPPSAASYIIANYTGTLSGTFSSTTVPPGYVLDYNTANQILLVQIPGGVPTYASWAKDNGIDGQPADGDADNDSVTNAVEMVVGGDPKLVMDAKLLPELALVTNPAGVGAGNYLEFTYRRTDISVTAGVAATCEYGTDLVSPWAPAVGGEDGVVVLVDNDYPPYGTATDRVRVYVPRGANAKLFGRLHVTVP